MPFPVCPLSVHRTRWPLVAVALLAGSLPALHAVNCIPAADVSGNWLEVGWGSSGGVTFGVPGNNNGEDDSVYLRRNNTITVDSDVSPSTLGFSGGLGRFDVGDGFDGPSRGQATLILTGNGRLRVERGSRALTNVSIVNTGRNRPNSVGQIRLEGQAELIGATLNVGVTAIAYDAAYLTTHTIPSTGHLRLTDQARATFSALVLGTTASINSGNTAAGFPGTSGLVEVVGSGPTLAVSGSVNLNSSGTLRLLATASALPHLSFGGTTTTESGFALHLALEAYDLAPIAAGSTPRLLPVLTLANGTAASALLANASVTVTGHDPATIDATVGVIGETITLTLASTQSLPPTGAGVQISHQPSPSTMDLLLGRDIYIADPAIAVMPDGSYLIAHSIFGAGTDQANLVTKVFRSTDRGVSWTQVTTMTRLQRANFFTHEGVVYCLGTGRVDDTESVGLVVRKSLDNGVTWTAGPATTGDLGWLRTGGTGTPSTPVIHENRVWMARSTLGLSGDLTQDLLTNGAWTVHNNPQSIPHADSRPAYRDAWPTYNDQTFALWSESQIVASPQTGVVLMPKIEMQPVTKGTTSVPHFAHIPHISLQTIPSPSASVQIDPATTFVPLPGTEKKFGATYDPATQRFYAITNTVLPAFETVEDLKHQGFYKPQLTRNTGTLYSSRDLRNWDLEKIFIHSDNVARQAWQYFNFVFDGDHLIIASRTAFRTLQDSYEPPRGHDSNLLTFHRIPNYHSLTVTHTLAIVGGTVTRAEPTDFQPAPLGNFALGAQPVQPVRLAEAPDRSIVIEQQNGQLLQYDPHGNFLGTLSQLPANTALTASPIQVVQPKTPQRTWTQPGGGAWYDPRNWHYFGIPDSAEEVATLGSAATATASLAIDRPTTLNGLTFRSATAYHLTAAQIAATNGTVYHTGGLTLAAHPDTAASPVLHNLLGRHTIAPPLNLAADTHLQLAAGTSLTLTGTVTLDGPVTAAIDLAGFDPAQLPLTLQSLTRSSPAGSLTLRLANIPASVTAATPVLRIEQLTDLTPADLTVTAHDGTPIPFTLAGGALTIVPPVLTVSLVDEYPTPADTSALNWYGSGAGHLNRAAAPGLKIVGVHTEGGSNSGLRHAVSHFADPRKPLSLEPGQSITLSARITPTSTTSLAGSNALRFGLFNTRNRPADFLVADGTAGTNLSTGYMIGLNTNNSGPGSIVAYSRSPDTAAALGNTYALIVHSSAFQNRGSSASLGPGKLTRDQTYSIRLTLTRSNATTIVIEGTISGGDLPSPAFISATDTPSSNRDGAICTAFDTIAFASANSSGIDDLRITDITLTTPRSETAPVVLLHPWDQSLPHSATLTWSTVANGTQPLSYAWYFDGEPIPAADGPTLTLADITATANAGLYTCAITNALGSVTTEAAIVEVSPAPLASQVFIHEYPNGTASHHLTWYGSSAGVLGANTNALELRGNLANGLPSPTGLRHLLTHFADTAHPVVLANGQTLTVALNLTPTITTALTGSNALRLALLNTFGRSENLISSHSNPGGVSAAGYAVFYHTNTGGFSHAARRFIPPPADDDGPFFISSIYLNFSYPYQTLATQTGLVPGNTLQQGQTYRLTHAFTRISDTQLTITTTLSGGHITTPVTFTTTETAATNNRDGAIVTEFDTLAIAASGTAGLDTIQISDLQIIIPEQPGAPHIHSQPADQRILAGQPARFYTNASGQLPLSYQWYRSGILIPDATEQSYSLAAATEAEADPYTCVITNSAGTTTTRAAQLAIRTAETIVAPTPASYLASHMVLQRGKPNTIWGIANPNDPITITLVNSVTSATVASANTVADANGQFLAVLPALAHSTTPHHLHLSNPLDTTTLTNLLIGEVWLCGGQSNMAWSVSTANNSSAEIADAVNYPLIRVYKSITSGSVTPQENNPGTWFTGTPSTIRNTTAVGYFFARTLAQTALQGIPIGILDVGRGGSPAEAWFERETLRALGYTDYANSTGEDNYSGAALYNAMIHPIRHASLAGMAWYQGEANASSYARALEYQQLFPQLIQHWRNDVFRQADVPFNFVLLANFLRIVDTTTEGWAWARHAQLFALNLPNTAFAAAHDIGDYFDIHPRNKQDVGIRLALNALRHTYGYTHLEDTGPRALRASAESGLAAVIVSFDHATGLQLDLSRRVVFAPDPDLNLPNGFVCPDFQLAGPDGLWHAAEPTILAVNGDRATLRLSSPNVTSPRQVRYAWSNGPSSILFNTATHPVTGAPYLLPATPFLLAVDVVDPATLTAGELLSYAIGEVVRPQTDPADLPRLAVATNGAATFSFNRLRAGLNYLVEISADLAEWTVIAVNPGTVGGRVSVEVPATSDPGRFLRLRIALP